MTNREWTRIHANQALKACTINAERKKNEVVPQWDPSVKGRPRIQPSHTSRKSTNEN